MHFHSLTHSEEMNLMKWATKRLLFLFGSLRDYTAPSPNWPSLQQSPQVSPAFLTKALGEPEASTTSPDRDVILVHSN